MEPEREMAKRRKPKFIKLRFRKNDPDHNLLAAAQHWVHAHGGTIIVGGGIELQQWPGAPMGQYRIAVRCVGRLPKGKDDKKEAA